jgi:hypothetical protein
MDSNGNIFYKDDYDQFYRVDWSITNGLLDITTVIMQPFVFGQQEGYVRANTIYKKGIITVKQQIFKIVQGGYIIQAEGMSSYEDFIQMTFPCGDGPNDGFKFHLNNSAVDDFGISVQQGPRWADPDDINDVYMVWGDVNNDGSPVDITATGGATILEWLDVWG